MPIAKRASTCESTSYTPAQVTDASRPLRAAREAVSVVLITKNEERQLARCLESVAWADEIIVVDDESTDRTRELATRAGATVTVRRSHGDFDQQRNAGIEAATRNWILQLDADEIVTPALREDIERTIRAPGACVAYRIQRVNVFLGHPMRHGGWGWHGVKLFRRGAARYIGHSVHETLDVGGPIGTLQQPIWHYPIQDLATFLDRQNFYTDVEANLLRERHPQLPTRALRQQVLWRPLKQFWKSYVKHGGWREGLHGLVFAALFAWTHYLKWAKYWAEEQGQGARGKGQGAKRELPVNLASILTENNAARNGKRATLSVVVLTKNEEARIGRCLDSVRWADELIVVDGLSTDRTVEICRTFGATVISHAFDGSFATDRNLGLEHAHGDWVLQIDADDVVTPSFRSALDALLCSDVPYAAMTFYRRSVLLGRAMRDGGWHYTVPNLLRRGRARYQGLVHERPVIDGPIGTLHADIEHHPCESLSVFFARHNRYTSLQAEEWIRTNGPPTPAHLRRQLWRRPWKTFWKSYIKKSGWREGLHGLVFAEFFAGVELIKWAKVWERSLRNKQPAISDKELT